MKFLFAVLFAVGVLLCALSAENTICSLPKDHGPCRAGKPRYFYNTEKKECEYFMYGGCHGNDNNFESVEACKRTCANL